MRNSPKQIISKGKRKFVHRFVLDKDLVQKTLVKAGFKPEFAQGASNHSYARLKRAEASFNCVIDSLILVNPLWFANDHIRSNVLLPLVRRIFKESLTNLTISCKEWKNFGLYLHNAVEGKEQPLYSGMYRSLLTLDSIKDVINGTCKPHKRGEMLAHLLSSRHFPEGDVDVARQAKTRFKSVVTEPWVHNPEIISDVFKCSKQIGRFIMKHHKLGSSSHISLSSAACYERSIQDGGRVMEVLDSIKEILTVEPDEDETIHIHGLTLFCPKGQPRFRHWCRPKPLTRWISGEPNYSIHSEEVHRWHTVGNPDRGINPDIELYRYDQDWFYQQTLTFGDYLPGESSTWMGVEKMHRLGFDSTLGDQIFVCALLKSDPIPKSRIMTAPEGGNKVRILGITEWWNTIIQQPLAHNIASHLRCLSCCASGLSKADQAWAFCKNRNGFDKKDHDFKLLSSDLKEATDHIPHPIAEALLQGFVSGCGLTSDVNDFVIGICCSPRQIFMDGKTFFTKRGIMMGEGLAKSVLTLHQVVAEQLAWNRTYPHLSQFVCDKREKPSHPRAYHVGGDDICALGEESYLNNITQSMIDMGAEVSLEKHGIYNVVAKYCERCFLVQPFLEGKARELCYREETYEEGPWIETLKVRLLSKADPATTRFRQKSKISAPGKAQSLMEALKYIHNEMYWPHWRKVLVRDRFLYRMGRELPPYDSKELLHLGLPVSLGGLGLNLMDDEDINDLLEKADNLTLSYLSEVNQAPNERVIRDFRDLVSNQTLRKLEPPKGERDIIREKVLKNDLPEDMPVISPLMLLGRPFDRREMAQECNSTLGGNATEKEIESFRKRQGFITSEELVDHFERVYAFALFLRGDFKARIHRVQPWVKRFGELSSRYRNLADVRPVLSKDDVVKAFAYRDLPVYYDRDVILATAQDEHFIEVDLPYIEELLLCMPSLKVRIV